MTLVNKELLLETARNISRNKHYNGEYFWNQGLPKGSEGCAMFRMLTISGAEVIVPEGIKRSEIESTPDVILDGKKIDFFYVYNIVAELTGIDKDFWYNHFLNWSSTASKEDTVKVLRLLAHGKFNFKQRIGAQI
jgi:hypothetical protein